jgi:hypothetical protein
MLSTVFGYAAAILAGLAVISVLVFVIVWAGLGILRELARYRARTMTPTSSRYWPEHSAVNTVESIVPPPAP